MGIVNAAGELIDFLSQPIDPVLTGEQIVATIQALAEALNGSPQIEGVGVALAASVLHGGVLLEGLTTLPGLGGFPLQDRLTRAFGRPCLIDNDANLALLAEAHFGAAKGRRNVLLLTLGTGIGGGLLLDGYLRCGSHSSSSEIGMMVIRDANGAYTPIENLASPGALMQQLGDPRGQLFERADSGDKLAQHLIDGMFEYLGMLVTNIHLLLDLDLVLLGGGLASVGPRLREGIQASFERICPPGMQFGLIVETGNLPAQVTGVIGAACLWFERTGSLPTLLCQES
jgi:predicted NBD/HSP70 family sugar kinase